MVTPVGRGGPSLVCAAINESREPEDEIGTLARALQKWTTLTLTRYREVWTSMTQLGY